MLTRWADPLPPDAISPVKAVASSAPLPPAVKRKGTPDLFDFDEDEDMNRPARKDVDMELDGALEDTNEDVDLDAGIDDWVVDDLGGGLLDDVEEKTWSGKTGVKEMGKLRVIDNPESGKRSERGLLS